MAGPIQKIRAVLALLAIMSTLGLAVTFPSSREGRRVRVYVAKLVTGYDGCMCGDCMQHYLGFQYGTCWTGAATHSFMCQVLLVKVCVYGFSAWALGPLAVGVGLAPRRRRRGCPSCGYDITGLPRDVCPECGSAIERPSEAAEAAKAGDGT